MNEKPGEFPFTRGVHPRMYASRLWTMRQYAGFGDAKQTNKRYRHLLSQGQTGLSVAFDLPTQMGYDPDDPASRAEVGRAGVSIATTEDMDVLLDGIPLDRVSISMTINATASILLALAVARGEATGVARAELSGTVQNDVLKEFIARGTYIFPPEPSLGLAIDVAEFCIREMPKWNFISISGYHMREAGSTAAQEVGFTLANGTAYVEACLKRGLPVDEVGRRVSFFFAAHSNFLDEVAKFRAARRLWARIMKERFKAQDPRAMMLRFHTQTGGSTLTAQQPANNVVRTSLQALAAVLGGTQSLHTNSMDEALSLPTEQAATLALRTQQILAFETGIPDVPDPFAGSVEIERRTDALEAEAVKIVEAIDGMGGALEAIRRQHFQTEIEKSAIAHQRGIESGERVIVGVNRYVEGGEPRVELQKIDPKLAKARARALAKFRKSRGNTSKATDALKRVSGNAMPAILDAVKSGVTLGEIVKALEEKFGRHRPGRTT